VSLAEQDLERIVAVAEESISAKSLLSAIMTEWKGPAGLAGELRRDYEQLPVGNANRVKLQTLIVQALLKFGDAGDDGEGDPDEVQSQLEETLRQLQGLDDAEAE
jgi:hypothetical protein